MKSELLTQRVHGASAVARQKGTLSMLYVQRLALQVLPEVARVADQVSRRGANLGDQMRRAGDSVGCNLWEGVGQRRRKGLNRLDDAMGSGREVVFTLLQAEARGLITPAGAGARVADQVDRLVAVTFKLAASRRRRAS